MLWSYACVVKEVASEKVPQKKKVMTLFIFVFLHDSLINTRSHAIQFKNWFCKYTKSIKSIVKSTREILLMDSCLLSMEQEASSVSRNTSRSQVVGRKCSLCQTRSTLFHHQWWNNSSHRLPIWWTMKLEKASSRMRHRVLKEAFSNIMLHRCLRSTREVSIPKDAIFLQLRIRAFTNLKDKLPTTCEVCDSEKTTKTLRS